AAPRGDRATVRRYGGGLLMNDQERPTADAFALLSRDELGAAIATMAFAVLARTRPAPASGPGAAGADTEGGDL
ncbi:hypothetical protein ADK38_02530, partial [Streptomyces varsoviensis]